jgi:hypothetical protein
MLATVWSYVLHPLHGNAYQWWSGPGSDLGEVTLIGLLIAAYRHINCEAPRCPRRGPYKTADGHKLCRKHHPDLPDHRLSLREIHFRHHKAKEHQ